MPAKSPDSKAAGKAKATGEAVKTDTQGNVMDAAYWVKQYVGLVVSLLAMGMVCVAGYAPRVPVLVEFGLSVNVFLYSGA